MADFRINNRYRISAVVIFKSIAELPCLLYFGQNGMNVVV